MKSMFAVALVIATCWVIIQLLPVVLVAVVALFVAGTLNPTVEWLVGKGVKRLWAIGWVFTCMFVLMVAIAALTIPPFIDQLSTVARHEPQIRAEIADMLAEHHLTESLAVSLRSVRYEQFAQSLASGVLTLSTRGIEIMAYLASSLFLALYIMIDRDRLRGGLFAMVARRYHIRLSRVVLNLETIVGGYIRGQLLTSTLMAGFMFILLTACGIENAMALAVFGGVADVLPYVGVFLTVIPAVIAASTHGLAITLVVLGVLLAYEEFESRYLIPRIYGRALQLPSSVVLFSLLAGGTLMGVTGALLALPVAAAVRMIIEVLRVPLPGEQIDDTEQRIRDEDAEREYQRRAEGVPAVQAAEIATGIAGSHREDDLAPDPVRALPNMLGEPGAEP